MTPRELNRATLDRQLLLRRSPMSVGAAVGRLLAVQAQEPASPYLALWNRVEGLRAADVDAAFADGTLVRASLLRVTLHAVCRTDWPAVHAAMTPLLRAARLADYRWLESDLTPAEAETALARLAAFATTPRLGADIQRMLDGTVGDPARMWWALRTFAPLHHVPTGGPWSFRQPASFVAASGSADHARSVRELVRRYLAAFGPASTSDVLAYTRLNSARIKAAVASLGSELTLRDGLLDLADAPPLPPADTPAPPRLLGMWDNVLLAYADRTRLIPADYRPLVVRRNGDVLPALLVDGYVAGVWRPTEGGIEATAFHRLSDADWAGLAAEARSLTAFVGDRDPALYRRYAHWWRKGIPAAEVRLLPA
ncbi:winged helix DNA-binding domain-containing protein [Asanoa sp. WMMD1127]|uniref:winged helix DNA-binding domain-containing protein n=1 Tax=Asanoa sp. WMMD1127 TaxID=3016107 RepID=UPI00241761C1|nr:winged helix DNA-binding domain-containing protein [Asanoa sp. WMMD1127]MDG4823952.1 winged helix DNA-binding domain-containing protein [Asanoa sp. WMMD1127]